MPAGKCGFTSCFTGAMQKMCSLGGNKTQNKKEYFNKIPFYCTLYFTGSRQRCSINAMEEV
jgi:hypothetical protein